MEDAIVIAIAAYGTPNGKVAHGLVRGSDRYRVRAVVDPHAAGCDAGQLLDGRRRGIPIVRSIADALAAAEPAGVALVGVATHGGRITAPLRAELIEAARRGLSIVSGLHDLVADDAEIAAEVARHGQTIRDLRRAPPRSELRFWTGAIQSVRAPRIAVLGTDCAVGKRTTARMLTEGLAAVGLEAEMIYTGQTGWMQGGRHGIILDALPNDYVSGELEGAIVACDRALAPDVMILEGQSSLRNPSGPCGAELLLSGQARAVVLQHAPGRRYFEGYEDDEIEIPDLGEELELIRMYGADAIALALSGEGLCEDELRSAQGALCQRHGIPVVCPLEDGAGELVAAVREHLAREAA